MPVVGCQSGGKPGFRWGSSGKCYTYKPGDTASRNAAKARAARQGAAARAAGYRGKEDTCMDCTQTTTVAVAFDKSPKKCCVDAFFGWKIYGEGQKLKCGICNNLLSSCRIEKGSFISEDYRTICAFLLRKAVYPTRDSVDKWLSNNPWNRRYDYDKEELVEVDVVRETVTGWVVIRQPTDWFAMGTLKAQWTSIGIVVITGNLREDVDDRIPTDAELQATADFVERI